MQKGFGGEALTTSIALLYNDSKYKEKMWVIL